MSFGRIPQILIASGIAVLLPAIAAAAALPGQIVPATCTGVNCTCADLIQLAQNVLNTGIYFAVFISGTFRVGWLDDDIWKIDGGKCQD